MASYQMTDAEQLPVGFVVKDKGGEKILNLTDLPAGSTCTIVSSNEAVVSVTMRPDGLTAVLGSVSQGNASISSELHIPAGVDFPAIDATSSDNISVTVSAPGTAEFGVGAPEAESGAGSSAAVETAARTTAPAQRASTSEVNSERNRRASFDTRNPRPTAAEQDTERKRRATWDTSFPGAI